jgi:WD40 repeat protein/serine/threonine protein kinase
MAHGELSGRTLGEFSLGELMSAGGYGAVYCAEQPALGREVVIKVPHEAHRDHPVIQGRFLREARLASQLDHPYAAHVYAFGVEEDGLMWIAMERVRGVTLRDWLSTHGPMAPELFVPFFERVAQVVHAAHELEIVHRDLKPSNVMVVERGGGILDPKLLDFGIAKAPPETSVTPSAPRPAPRRRYKRTERQRRKVRAGQCTPTRTAPLPPVPDGPEPSPLTPGQITRSGDGLGSYAYMSPEQWHHARRVSPAADIYALGALAYKLLTGREPFAGELVEDYREMHMFAEVPSLGEGLRPFDRAIRVAMSKMPADRYATALELAAELRLALRSMDREQLRAAAQQWDDRRRSPGLLWGREEISDLDRWRQANGLSPLECSFVAESQRRAHRAIWWRRALVAVGVVVASGGIQYRATMQARMSARVAEATVEATITQAELEQGRSALLHGEDDAAVHLGRAYRRDPTLGAAFMLARAVQPRLAELVRLTSSSGRMRSAVFSPDERQIATSDDRDARIWDAESGRLIRTLAHGTNVYQIAYSTDGAKLYTAAGDDAVRIWDAASGALLRRLSHRQGAPLRYLRLALSPDGRHVAALDVDGRVAHVWDAITGELRAELLADASGAPALAFSADGRWMAITGGQDVGVFEAAGTWRQIMTVRGSRVRRLAFDPEGAHLVTGGASGEVAMWNVPRGDRFRNLRENGDPVDAVAVAPDGRSVAVGIRDGTTMVWDASTGELRGQFNPRGSKVSALEFDRDSRTMLAAATDGSVTIADARQVMPLAVLDGPSSLIWSAHFDRSGQRVVGASWDGTARVWSAAPLYRRWNAPAPGPACDMDTNPEPDGRYLAVGCRGNPTQVWDTAEGRLVAELPAVTRVDGDFLSAFPAVSSTGDRAAIARGHAVEVYELPSGRLLRSIDHVAAVNTVAFSPSSRDVVSGAVDGSLLVARDGGALLRFPSASAGIDAVAILPDGRVLTVDAGRHLHAYDRGGASLAEFALPFRVLSLRVDGSARVVALPSYLGDDAPPMLIDMLQYRILARLEGHVGRVFSAHWLPSGEILTAGGDGTARRWDGRTGLPLQVYQGRRLLTDAVAADGVVIGGGADGVLRFWDQTSGRQIWTLTALRSQVVGLHVEGSGLITRGIAGELTRWEIPQADQVIASCDARKDCAIVSR